MSTDTQLKTGPALLPQRCKQTALTLWRSRSIWGNCSVDNPQPMVSVAVFIPTQSSSSVAQPLPGSAWTCSALISTLFVSDSPRRKPTLTPEKLLIFPLGVRGSSRVSRWKYQIIEVECLPFCIYRVGKELHLLNLRSGSGCLKHWRLWFSALCCFHADA